MFTLNLQEDFPAVQNFYPNDFRMISTPIGMLIGTLATPIFLDRYRLRHFVFFGAYISILCAVVMPFAFAPEIIIVDRLFFGISIGMLLTKYCVFVSFAVPTDRVFDYTAFLVSGFAGGCTLASLVSFLSYTEDIFSRNFRIPYFVGIVLVFGWTLWVSMFLPEGPWFFIREGNDDAASRIMAAFHGKSASHQDVQDRIRGMKLALKNAQLKSPTLITPLTANLRAKTLVAATLLFFTFASFPATILFYGPKLLNTAFDGKTKMGISIVFSVVFFIFSLFNRLIVKSIKRKNIMLISAALLTVLTIILCFVSVQNSLVVAVIVLCLCSGIVAVWLVISLSTVMLLFDDDAKSRCIALSLASAWFGSILVLLFDVLVPKGSVFLMAAISLISLIWIKLSPLPEQNELSAYQKSRNDLLRQSTM